MYLFYIIQNPLSVRWFGGCFVFVVSVVSVFCLLIVFLFVVLFSLFSSLSLLLWFDENFWNFLWCFTVVI